MKNFVKCHNLTNKELHGEVGSVNAEPAKEILDAIREKGKGYELEYIYNVGETGPQ